ncbi:hypothetical protein ACH5RR_012423 [Cinchona calisaya]|uniref:Uncharacterized protein n=1 Tax=Cinchona calisaya TaxID=153742 RepID=A0ABD3AAA8_9GENT
MGENSSSEGYPNNRVVLGDVTNQLGKRGISSISGDGICDNVDRRERARDKGKRACISPRPCSRISSLKGNVIMGISKIPNEIKDPKLLKNVVDSSTVQATMQASDDPRCSLEDGVSRRNCVSDTDCAEVEVICDSEEGQVGSGGSQDDDTDAHVSENDGDDHGVDNFVLSQTGSVDCTRLPESQESRNFELERCSGLKADGCLNSVTDTEFIKSCSCSFCTKAAYILLDLHYQDMKGRIAALKKSQKDASILVERSCRNKGTEKHGTRSSSKQPNLEHDLMTQWRSLFLHMEDIFAHESKGLEASLLSLKDLRDKCKTELEVINGTTPENH